MKTGNRAMDGSKIILAAHRGDRVNYPENTMIAMRSAVEMGCDMIETDLHMTKDGHLIIMHDRDVKRTTNGSGLICEMTLEELRQLDAGSWKDEKFAGEKIPTVEEFAEYISGTDLMVDWELKDFPMHVGDDFAFECVDKLVAILEKYDLVERSIINSFSDRVLEYVADKWPGRFAILCQGICTTRKNKDEATKPIESFIHWVSMHNMTPEHPAGVKEEFDYVLAHNLLPCSCFDDVEEYYQAALNMGSRMFTSNDPGKAIEILKKLGVR